MNQFDDQLGHEIARRRLGAKNERARNNVQGRVLLQAVIEHDDVKNQQQLALVLVQPFDLDIKHRIGRNVDPGFAGDELGQQLLVLLLGGAESLPKDGVIHERFQLPKLIQIGDPLVADVLGNQMGKSRIGAEEPAPGGDAVGFVVEFLRPQFREIPQHLVLQKLGVEFGDAVHRAGAHDGQVGHANVFLPCLVDNAHAAQAVILQRPPRGDIPHKPGIDFVNDLQMPGKQSSEHLDGPLLQRLRQNGVVGVAGGRGGDSPGLIPAQPFAIDQQTHQLRDDQRGVRVVELDKGFAGKLFPILIVGLEAPEDVLN